MTFEDNMDMRVLLLGFYKRSDDETLIDVIKTMENSRVFTLKEGKKYLKELKALGYVIDDTLSMIGIEKAKLVEQEFKL